MEPRHRRIAVTLLVLVCGACLAAGCAQLLGIDDLPEGCTSNDDCGADAPICSASGQCVAGCTTAAACDGVTPVCNEMTGTCESCNGSNLACALLDDGKPFCATEGANEGACVACVEDAQCAVTAETPICGEDNTCRACQAHDECDSNACDRATGACVAESAVAYVVSGGTGDCSRAAPCGTIAAALEFIRANNEDRYVVRLDNGTYTEQVALGDITVSIIGDGATVQLSGTPRTPRSST